MEYLWDKEKSNDFTYWLEDKQEQDAKQNYWEQMKDPKGYFNCDKYPWVPLPEEELHTQEHGATIEAWSMEKKTPKELVPPMFHDYLTVFEQTALERMPVHKPWDHAIDLKPGFQPKKGKIYLLSPDEQKEVQDFLLVQLEKGYIRPSKSPQTSPVFFITKKGGKKCMVQDYHHINDWTVKNNYPLPLILELVDRAGSAKVFTKLDLRWGYNNVRIKERDEWKAAFSTFEGSYKPLVMFFGLTNSPATFQTMMNEIFKDMIDEGMVIIYINDILIYTKMEAAHDEITREVLRQLRENDLYIKPEKCFWKVREVEFLGVMLGLDRIKMDPTKLDAVKHWPTPLNMKDVQQFIGFANYY